MPLGEQIDEGAAPPDAAGMADFEPGLDVARDVGVELVRAVADVLQALVTGGDEVAIQRRGVVALLDQLHLEIARIGKGERHVHRRRLALVTKINERDVLEIEPRPYLQHLDPVPHGGFDVAYHETVLQNAAK